MHYAVPHQMFCTVASCTGTVIVCSQSKYASGRWNPPESARIDDVTCKRCRRQARRLAMEALTS